MSDELEDQLARARVAMGGNARPATPAPGQVDPAQAELLAKARLAMEGPARQQERARKERENQEKEMIRKRIDAEVQAQKAEEERKKKEIEQQLREEELEEERKRNEKIARYQESKQLIEDLKKESKSTISPIRTIESDAARSVEEGMTPINTIPMTDLLNTKPAKRAPLVTKKAMASLLAIFALIILSAGLIYYVYAKKHPAVSTIVPTTIDSIVFADKNFPIDINALSKNEIIEHIVNDLNEPTLQPGELANIFITRDVTTGSLTKSRPATLAEFAKSMEYVIPDDITANLKSDFMLGVLGGQPHTLFFIFKVKNYEKAIVAMQKHENDFVRKMFPTISGAYITPNIGINAFVDKTIRNISTRMIPDQDTKEVAMVYSFVDRETLIIAQTEKEFIKVLDAYNTPKPKI